MENKKTGLVVIILSLLVVALGGYIVYDKVLKEDNTTVEDNENNNVEKNEIRTIKCTSDIGGQYGLVTEKTTYTFENNKLKSISLYDKVVLTGIEVTGNEYKDHIYALSNFCMNSNKCKSEQNGNVLDRQLTIDFTNSEDLNKYKEFQDITIEEILNNSINGNDLASRHQECFEVK